jgi:FkbM family methyltransferase
LKLHPRTGKGYYEGKVELVVQHALVQWLRRGMVFYDIGANIGFFTLIAASIVGNEGKVFSFEPEPELVPRLKEHIGRNGFSNVSVVQAGVWSATGRAAFVRSDPLMSPERGTGNLSPAASGGNGVSVPSIALDDFVRGSPLPDLIKCDAEGAEVEVFQGAARLLAEHRPRIVCEVHSESNSQRLKDLLEGYGYKLHLLDESHLLALPHK